MTSGHTDAAREIIAARRAEIERELVASGAEVLLTLGDQPLKWFAQHYGTAADLSAYGQTPAQYGRLHSVTVAGRKLHLLPLVHPRQAARLGSHSAGWAELHDAWVANPPADVLTLISPHFAHR